MRFRYGIRDSRGERARSYLVCLIWSVGDGNRCSDLERRRRLKLVRSGVAAAAARAGQIWSDDSGSGSGD
ncbi:hypothetical protein FCV25MIE_25080 [Fagus crenata]